MSRAVIIYVQYIQDIASCLIFSFPTHSKICSFSVNEHSLSAGASGGQAPLPPPPQPEGWPVIINVLQ